LNYLYHLPILSQAALAVIAAKQILKTISIFFHHLDFWNKRTAIEFEGES